MEEARGNSRLGRVEGILEGDGTIRCGLCGRTKVGMAHKDGTCDLMPCKRCNVDVYISLPAMRAKILQDAITTIQQNNTLLERIIEQAEGL